MAYKLFLIATTALGIAASASAQDAKSALQRARTALGDPAALEYSGAGTNGFFGQAMTAGQPWPMRPLDAMSVTIDYTQKAAKLDMSFHQPVFGGQHQVTFVNGDRAWSVGANGPVPQLDAAEERQLQIWMSPHGFLRAAAAANPTVISRNENGAKVDVVSFTVMGKYKVAGTIDSAGLVTHVETMVANPVLGDTDYSFDYRDYKEFSGIKFPTHIVQSEGGFPVNDLTIATAQVKAAAGDLAVPPAIQTATVAPVKIDTQQLADGVWVLGGGSHHSVVVAFNDFSAIIEGPVDGARASAVMAEARRLVPGKPIKYVIGTHHHFDHAGGLRTFVAEGVTVVTHASNQAYYEKALTAPATIVPDAQSKAHATPHIQPVNDKFVITDGKQTIEVHNIVGDGASSELLVAYIPTAKVLVEADSYSPGPVGAPAPNPIPPNAIVLYDNIQRLKLNVATVVGVHGRGPVPMAEFQAFVGKRAG